MLFRSAATFYNLLTGLLPRDFARGKDPLLVVLDSDVIPIRKREASIPKPLAAVLDHALSVDPRQRFQDAREFRSALVQAVR